MSVQGTDSFKEQGVPLYGNKLLERRFAVLQLDWPGQGETLVEGMKVTLDNLDEAGHNAARVVARAAEAKGASSASRGFGAGSGPIPSRRPLRTP